MSAQTQRRDHRASRAAQDWLYADQRIDHVCARPGNFLNKPGGFLEKHPDAFVMCVNIQVPAAKQFSIIFYFALPARPAPDSVFGRFIDGDDVYRNARFKLIPQITQGAWVVARSVGTKPLIVGNALKVEYWTAPNYIELGVDIGTSSVANSICKFVIGYLRTLVIDLAFLIESKTEADLPEKLLGVARISQIDPDAATPAYPPA